MPSRTKIAPPEPALFAAGMIVQTFALFAERVGQREVFLEAFSEVVERHKRGEVVNIRSPQFSDRQLTEMMESAVVWAERLRLRLNAAPKAD